MTMPIPSVDPPKDVQTVETIGAATQNLNPTKVTSTATGRMSQGFLDTNAGLAGSVVSTATNLFGQFAGKIADDTDSTTVSSPDDVADQVQGFFSNPVTALFSSLLTFLSPILQGLTSGLSGVAATLAGLFQIRWDQVDNHDTAITDLQDKTQALEGVIGYGCRYMSTGAGVQTSPATLNFDTQVGPALGVTLLSGGKYRLNSKGLWRFESQVIFNDSKWSPPRCYMDIVIKDTSGNEFARLKALAVSDAPITVTNVMPVVIPAAGYTAEVQAWTSSLPLIGAAWRTIGSGLSYTRFSVFKISSETS